MRLQAHQSGQIEIPFAVVSISRQARMFVKYVSRMLVVEPLVAQPPGYLAQGPPIRPSYARGIKKCALS